VTAFDRPRFLRLFFGLFLIFTFAPLAIVALFSFNSTPSLQDFSGFSLQWYDEFFSSVGLRESLVASIEIGLVTMVVGTVLGTTLAFALVRARSRVARTSNVLMLIPLVTPEIVATLKEVKPAVLQVLREDEQLRRTGILQCERQVFELAREYFR
jgi:spermidine/putrescine transport system permease protein/putrescine transport system permease protein